MCVAVSGASYPVYGIHSCSLVFNVPYEREIREIDDGTIQIRFSPPSSPSVSFALRPSRGEYTSPRVVAVKLGSPRRPRSNDGRPWHVGSIVARDPGFEREVSANELTSTLTFTFTLRRIASRRVAVAVAP